MTQAMGIILHDYWRSGASYRTRIALNLKAVDYQAVSVDLLHNAQRGSNYLSLNPQGLVPTLEADDSVLTQSSAILEWLEECFPSPPLLPTDPFARATVRAMSMIIACDIHPLNNLRVLKAIEALGADDEAKQVWIARWISDGFAALEAMIVRHGGTYAFGDRLSLADCHLVPQVYSAERFGVPLGRFPQVERVAANAHAVPQVAAAHPDNCRKPEA